MILNRNAIIKVLSAITVIFGLSMAVPMGVSLAYGEAFEARCFGLCGAALAAAGAAVILLMPKADTDEIGMRDGYFIVAVTWIMVSVYGAFPFMLTGDIPDFVDAFFESISGITTTGSTLLSDVEVLSRGGAFWRSFTHWLGGMGVLLMTLVLLPMLGTGGQKLLKAETTGPSASIDGFSARKTAIKLYWVFIGTSVSMYLLLRLGGLDPYDAAVHMFGALGTGGYSTYNTSIGTFDSYYVDMVVSVFMIICSLNFSLIILCFQGKAGKALRDAELRGFLLMVAFTTAFMTEQFYVNGTFDSLAQCFRYAFFHSTSIASSSGYSTMSSAGWPVSVRMTMFLLMIIGGCAASTSGGIKVVRAIILLKLFKKKLTKKLKPDSDYHISLNGRVLPAEVVRITVAYSIIYMLTTVIGTVLLTFDGVDFLTALPTVISSMSNIGPDYLYDGTVMCFGVYSKFGKLLCAFLMYWGRLEFFTVMMMFSKKFWDKD